jgi:hypothetical protein
MASYGHYSIPYPRHFAKDKCKRCKTATATRYLKATKMSRSQNPREFVVGVYCDECLPGVIADARRRK